MAHASCRALGPLKGAHFASEPWLKPSSSQAETSCGQTRLLRTGLYKRFAATPSALKKPSLSRRSSSRGARCQVPGVQSIADLRTPALQHIPQLDIDIPQQDPKSISSVDLLVVGAGPAGLAVAEKVSAAGFKVLVVDPAPKAIFPNNYGVWVDEFEEMGLGDCMDYKWDHANVWLTETDRRRLDRPYGRVNRRLLKHRMLEGCLANGVIVHKAKVDGVVHDTHLSRVTCSDGACFTAAAVVDATGHSRRLVKYDEPFDPGYQAAYGILAEVDQHPFDMDAMLFMDWRDSHLDADPEMKERNRKLPTFLYAMPLSETKVFLEETSLVARPAVPFDECIARLEARLKHLNVHIRSIEEEEFCLIPMGGVLPAIPQRVMGIGGTAGMVHPSTGYMVARTLAAAPTLADALILRLAARRRTVSPLTSTAADLSERAAGTAVATAPQVVKEEEGVALGGDDLSAGVWAELWPVDRVQQREFFCFGMDVLLKLDLDGTRRFFSSFFSLSPYHWQGFLSSRLYFVELIKFGLSLFANASNQARAEIVWKGIPGLGVMLTRLATMKR